LLPSLFDRIFVLTLAPFVSIFKFVWFSFFDFVCLNAYSFCKLLFWFHSFLLGLMNFVIMMLALFERLLN
jgi:hypothetical protein